MEGLISNRTYPRKYQSVNWKIVKLMVASANGSIVKYSLFSTVQCSLVQYSLVQYSLVQFSTVQYSLVQYSAV